MALMTAAAWQPETVSRMLADDRDDEAAQAPGAGSVGNVDEIVIRVPAATSHVRIAQVGAVSVARRQVMSSSETDELRAAVAQAGELLSDQTAGSGAVIEFVFRAQHDRLEMRARRRDRPDLRFNRRFDHGGGARTPRC